MGGVNTSLPDALSGIKLGSRNLLADKPPIRAWQRHNQHLHHHHHYKAETRAGELLLHEQCI